jgi:hypothetical protein
MSRHHCDMGTDYKSRDVVKTPDRAASAIIARYKPTGLVLDPCRGDGAFYNKLPGSLWCELQEGRDFFDWNRYVDWIIGNPPFSILNQWLDHSFKLADHVVYLLPIAKVFGSRLRLRKIFKYGGIVDIWAPWTGRDIGFEFGWAVGSVYFQRDFRGKTTLGVSTG